MIWPKLATYFFGLHLPKPARSLHDLFFKRMHRTWRLNRSAFPDLAWLPQRQLQHRAFAEETDQGGKDRQRFDTFRLLALLPRFCASGPCRCFVTRLVKSSGAAALCLVPLLATAETWFASPAALECPASIPEQSVQLVSTPPGWKSFVGAPLYLHAAEAMVSPPELLGALIPDDERRGKTGMIDTYQIDGTFPHGKWLACRYGEADQVTLSRALPDDTKACTFSYRKGEYVGQNLIKIDCR